jgi:signal transduction histidine kinase
MLHEFISVNRDDILTNVRRKVVARKTPSPTTEQFLRTLPGFLAELIKALSDDARSSASLVASPGATEVPESAPPVYDLIHGYGDVCQAITDLAIASQTPISAKEYRVLNLVIDASLAEAVSTLEKELDQVRSEDAAERAGFLAHELRNFLTTAKLSVQVLERGHTPVEGRAGATLWRALNSLGDLIDQSIVSVRLASRLQARQRLRISELMEELRTVAAVEAQNRGHRLETDLVDLNLEVEADRHLLNAALTNLVRNAFKFTPPPGRITLRVIRVEGGRVRIEVEDQCGGFPPGKEQELFRPFVQHGVNRSGLGLGLVISRRCVRASGGDITLQNKPGQGCIFSVEMPLASGGGIAAQPTA